MAEHVKLDEWKKLQGSGSLVADNISSAVCLAVYNPFNQTGYMAHSSNLGNKSSFYGALRALVADAIPKNHRKDATAWLTGAVMPPESANPTYLQEIARVEGFRKNAQGFLKAQGVRIEPIQWPEPGQIARFILTIGDDGSAIPNIHFRPAK